MGIASAGGITGTLGRVIQFITSDDRNVAHLVLTGYSIPIMYSLSRMLTKALDSLHIPNSRCRFTINQGMPEDVDFTDIRNRLFLHIDDNSQGGVQGNSEALMEKYISPITGKLV